MLISSERCHEYNPENTILLLAALITHCGVLLFDGVDIWPAVITFLLRADLLVFFEALIVLKFGSL